MTLEIQILKDGVKLKWKEVLTLLRDDDEFRNLFRRLMINVPMESYFFESSKITKNILCKFVFIDSQELFQLKPNYEPFKEYFVNNTNAIVNFFNLNKDAMLIVPNPNFVSDTNNNKQIDLGTFTHIANFVRNAPAQQVNALLQSIGSHGLSELKKYDKIWISTSGLGVHWLHVRISALPKYYNYIAYK